MTLPPTFQRKLRWASESPSSSPSQPFPASLLRFCFPCISEVPCLQGQRLDLISPSSLTSPGATPPPSVVACPPLTSITPFCHLLRPPHMPSGSRHYTACFSSSGPVTAAPSQRPRHTGPFSLSSLPRHVSRIDNCLFLTALPSFWDPPKPFP